MSKRQTAIDRAIEALDLKIDALTLARDEVAAQRNGSTRESATRKPKPKPVAVDATK